MDDTKKTLFTKEYLVLCNPNYVRDQNFNSYNVDILDHIHVGDYVKIAFYKIQDSVPKWHGYLSVKIIYIKNNIMYGYFFNPFQSPYMESYDSNKDDIYILITFKKENIFQIDPDIEGKEHYDTYLIHPNEKNMNLVVIQMIIHKYSKFLS